MTLTLDLSFSTDVSLVCVCLCVCACMCACMCVRVRVCVCVCAFVCFNVALSGSCGWASYKKGSHEDREKILFLRTILLQNHAWTKEHFCLSNNSRNINMQNVVITVFKSISLSKSASILLQSRKSDTLYYKRKFYNNFNN